MTGLTEKMFVYQCQARKKSTKINFLTLGTAGWGRALPREGVVVENFVPSLEFVFLAFRREEPGMSWEFCWDVPNPWECSKVCAKKFVLVFGS